jgi:hypothetical protein
VKWVLLEQLSTFKLYEKGSEGRRGWAMKTDLETVQIPIPNHNIGEKRAFSILEPNWGREVLRTTDIPWNLGDTKNLYESHMRNLKVSGWTKLAGKMGN